MGKKGNYVFLCENIWLYFLNAWLNYIFFPSNTEVIRCSFSIWQNDEFPHRILHWGVNVFNKLHSILKPIDCGEGVAAGQLPLHSFLMQPCQIPLTFFSKHIPCEFLHTPSQIHRIDPILMSQLCCMCRIWFDLIFFLQFPTDIKKDSCYRQQ